MPRRSRHRAFIGIAILSVLGVAFGVSADPKPNDVSTDDGTASSIDAHRVSLETARDRARILHASHLATLEAMHKFYFRTDHAVLPARAMEDVFADMAKETKVRARWISVNTKAMSVQHEPKSEFEKEAAAVLSDGKKEFEQVKNGYYHRAGGIPLGNGCVHCHTKLFGGMPNSPRFAGLVISIPVTTE